MFTSLLLGLSFPLYPLNLLVLNTLDGEQLAMHGQAYPLAVELRGVPLLML